MPARAARRESGQTAAEYVGLVGLVGVLVMTLVALAPVTGRAKSVIDAAYCRIAGMLDGGVCPHTGAGPGEGGPARVREQTPRERAEAGGYVALGDSYSSGEGADDYVPGTDVDANRCHRSAHAYGQQVYADGHFAGTMSFGACSGSVIDDYYGANHAGNAGEGPQRDHIGKDTSLVTLSMGGNDFGFAQVLEHCVTHGCDTEDYRRQLQQTIAADADRLVGMYRDLRDRVGPDARIIVVDYPHLFAADGTHGLSYSSTITASERRFLNEVGDMADTAIADAVRRADAGVELVDIRDDFAGHEVGTEDPWIHDLDIDWNWASTAPASSSFHPTAAGQHAIAVAVEHQIDQPIDQPIDGGR